MWKHYRYIKSISLHHLCLGGDRASQQLRTKRVFCRDSIVAHTSQSSIVEDRIQVTPLGYYLTASIFTAYSSTTRMPKEEAGTKGQMPKSSRSASLAQSIISSVPKKRKSSPQPKFYAVRAGRTPGVYLTYKECERNITGFKNATCRYFR